VLVRYGLLIALGFLAISLSAFARVFFRLPSYFLHTLAVLLLGTASIYYYLLHIQNKKPAFFVQFYLLSIVFKFLFYIIYLVFIIHEDPPEAMGNAVFFIITYILFTAVEVGFLLHRINR
jgi:hypothetical protein